MEKNVLVKISGAPEPREATIHPGCTAGEALQSIGLNSSMSLSKDPTTGSPFGMDEVIYDQVDDGSKLFAVPAVVVGK